MDNACFRMLPIAKKTSVKNTSVPPTNIFVMTEGTAALVQTTIGRSVASASRPQ
jgi:hypothetical protein